jgi:hypothetical protein
MSLDFYLTGPNRWVDCHCSECGHKHKRLDHETFFSTNITHNLNTMAEKAGIYKALWRPDEIGAKKAKDIILLLDVGLEELESKPDVYRQYDSPNGWGLYEHFVPFVREVLEACRKHPNAKIEVSR